MPVGAVGLAGPFTGVYPSASPGGWQLIGQTDLALWDPSREQPATLPARDAGAFRAGGLMGAERVAVVLHPGPLTTVQDLGRPGWAHLGVPRAGVLDRPAAALANRVVGNDVSAAVLETTLGGLTVRVEAAMTVAVTGARAEVWVDARHRPWGEPLALHAGSTLRVGPALEGVRSYVAFAGGLDVPAVLGSRSTDILCGVGPSVLSAGDRLPVGAPHRAPHAVDVVIPRLPARPVSLRFVPGPRLDWFAPDVLAVLGGSTYRVLPESNRVGLRLHGPRLERRGHGELPSEGLLLGAIQVPPDGQPLVFLNDHPTTGGYPVLGVVSAGELTSCAQLRPGDRVRLSPR